MEKNDFKILVAEDDEIVRDVIVKFLADVGYPVFAVDDGLAAIKLLRLEDIKLILTDLRMPGADGMEVLRTAIQMDPRIAVVLLTAYGTLDTALEAMKEGAYDYIVKPFVMQQLLLIVRNAFKVAMILRENESLSSHLKELYKNHETVKNSEVSKNNIIKQDPAGRIEKLKELNIINADEAHILRERLKPGDENIRKYSSLVKDLKKSIK